MGSGGARHSRQCTRKPHPGGRRRRWRRRRGQRACYCGARSCASGPYTAIEHAARRCARQGRSRGCRGAEQRAWRAGAGSDHRAGGPGRPAAAGPRPRRARMHGRLWAAVSGVGGGARELRPGRAAHMPRAASGDLLQQTGRGPGCPRTGTGGGCRAALGGPGGAAPRARGPGGRARSGQGERCGGRRVRARQASGQPAPALAACAPPAGAACIRALPVARQARCGVRGARRCRRRARRRQCPLPCAAPRPATGGAPGAAGNKLPGAGA